MRPCDAPLHWFLDVSPETCEFLVQFEPERWQTRRQELQELRERDEGTG